MSEITALVAGGRSRRGGGQVHVRFDAGVIEAERTLADGTQLSGSAPLGDHERERLLELAAGVTPELQEQVRPDPVPNQGQFVEVHRGEQVVRVENPSGMLVVEPAHSLVVRAIHLLAVVAPVPPPHD